jgi:hypothetical protein
VLKGIIFSRETSMADFGVSIMDSKIALQYLSERISRKDSFLSGSSIFS